MAFVYNPTGAGRQQSPHGAPIPFVGSMYPLGGDQFSPQNQPLDQEKWRDFSPFGGSGAFGGGAFARPHRSPPAIGSPIPSSSSSSHRNRRGKGGVNRSIRQAHDLDSPRESTPHIKKGSGSQVVGIAQLTILHDPPVEDCLLKPYVILKCENGGQQAVENHEEDLRFRWYRGQKRMCAYSGCQKAAKIQATTMLKLGMVEHQTFFCSKQHFRLSWPQRRHLIQNKTRELRQQSSNAPSHQPIIWPTYYDDDENHEPVQSEKQDQDIGQAVACRWPPMMTNIWAEVSSSKSKHYTPKLDDIGRMLRLECAPIIKSKEKDKDGNPITHIGPWVHRDTMPVLPKPQRPPKRHMIYTHSTPDAGSSTFKVLSYNTLAPIYATQNIYSYCPMYALNWNYRKNILIREIIEYECDIVCLQEVQGNHFEDFFQPRMSELGYDGIFKQKNRESMDVKQVDGCAIFYKKDRFALMEQYHIEFNEAAKNMIQNRSYLKRLLKGNIALVLVLEEISSTDHTGRRPRNRRKRRLCVANTHIYWDPDYADVKLWQTWVLCQELSKLVLGRRGELPLLLCGDFNIQPASSAYSLLTHMKVDSQKLEECVDQQQHKMYPSPAEMTHQLPLVSAYAVIGEPKYTNYTGHFVGILDYIWYTKNHLVCSGILDVDDEKEVSKHKALPSKIYASDHISLLAEFTWAPQQDQMHQ